VGHRPINRSFAVLPYLGILRAGQSVTLSSTTSTAPRLFTRAAWTVGGAPSAAATLTLSNGTDSQALTVSGDGSATFANPLKVTASQTLTLSTTDGKGMYDITVELS
jgi:hypothetical protein